MADYKKYCGEYGIETAALHTCMDKNDHSLTKTCVRALVDAGEVSQAEAMAQGRHSAVTATQLTSAALAPHSIRA